MDEIKALRQENRSPRPGRGDRGRRRLRRTFAGGVLKNGDGGAAWRPQPLILASPIRRRKSFPRRSKRCAKMPSSAPAARTTPTRSITSPLPLHLSRSPGCRCHHHYRRNEDGRREGHRRTGPGGAVGGGRPAYGEKHLRIRPEYLIPKPSIRGSSSRSLRRWRRPGWIPASQPDRSRLGAYLQGLNELSITRLHHEAGVLLAKKAPKRIVFSEGEDERVLRAVQVIRDEGIAQPILIGRRAEINRRIESAGLHSEGADFEIIYTEGASLLRCPPGGILADLPSPYREKGFHPTMLAAKYGAGRLSTVR